MRIAYLDCFSGISGDMFLGALVDAGVSPKLLEDTVAALDIGARLEIKRVMRGGISATKVDVYSTRRKRSAAGSFLGAGTSTIMLTDMNTRRGLNEIRQIIEKAAISSTAKRNRDSHLRGAGRSRSRDS